MKHLLNESFLKIVSSILEEKKNVEEWAEIESSDMFQNNNYIGGFDAAEMEFCFSVYIDKIEYWFQLSLEDMEKVARGEIKEVDSRPADK